MNHVTGLALLGPGSYRLIANCGKPSMQDLYDMRKMFFFNKILLYIYFQVAKEIKTVGLA